MKTIKIKVEATAMSCKITCNGKTRSWERTGNGSCRGNEKGDWEDLFSDGIPDILDHIQVLDLMYECGMYKKPEVPSI